jgi:hypothetical protein
MIDENETPAAAACSTSDVSNHDHDSNPSATATIETLLPLAVNAPEEHTLESFNVHADVEEEQEEEEEENDDDDDEEDGSSPMIIDNPEETHHGLMADLSLESPPEDVTVPSPRGRPPQQRNHPSPVRCINPASEVNARLDTQVNLYMLKYTFIYCVYGLQLLLQF